ncbi:MAG: hypothetical protein J6U40_03605, partial [Kiritimatiellae bacterium]|nr:hypothetical protein [Kiritimatiellia bacterium]
ACRITSEAVEAGVKAVSAGVSEAEIANVIALEMVRLSGNCFASSPWSTTETAAPCAISSRAENSPLTPKPKTNADRIIPRNPTSRKTAKA